MAPWIWNSEDSETVATEPTVEPTVEPVVEPVVEEPAPAQPKEAEWLDALQHDPSQLQHMSVDKLQAFDTWLDNNPEAVAAGNLRSVVHYLANIE